MKLISMTDVKQDNIFEDPEIKWMQRARHPRLVLFFGAGRADDGRVFYVMELMREGTLTQAFMNARENETSLSWCERLGLLSDVAEGMQYLHRVMGSIHRDLKGQNVLLCRGEGRRRAKVADFGLSRIVDRGRSSRKTSRAIKKIKSSSRSTKSIDSTTKIADEGERLTSFSVTPTSVSCLQVQARSLYDPPHPRRRGRDLNYPQLKELFFRKLHNVFGTRILLVEYNIFLNDVRGVESREGVEDVRKRSKERGLPIRVFPKSVPAPHGYQSLLEKCWSQEPDDRRTLRSC